MLAPRKKLWSTPPEVVQSAIEALQIEPSDIVYDIGAGDGRFVIKCAQSTGVRCVGVEIDETRHELAVQAIESAGLGSLVSMVCANALELDYSEATALFLYLIPRGLRLIAPLLQKIPHPIRVVTYMSPLPPEFEPIETIKVPTTGHLAGAEWPLFVYKLTPPPPP
jgi:16S rRNA A1518/A1519 N6-dimethyltransferase RsmA/KsgA/DIM1 with predicted DNA glycosylase/AP lyase activity